jgi:hypothetical protein
MVHVFGPPAYESLRDDERLCRAPDASHRDVHVNYHVGAVTTALGWICSDCGYVAEPDVPRVAH